MRTQGKPAFPLPLDRPPLAALVAAAKEYDVYLVGGYPRDFLLDRPSHDFDVVVSGGGREIAQAVAASTSARLVPLGHHEQATYRLVGADFVLDILDRGGLSFEEDLRRRDLTINAIAVDLPSGRWLDPTGGRQDLEERILRAPRPGVFTEDPLRVLRLARFVAQLPGFEAEARTLEQARSAVSQLSAVAKERIRVELDLLFDSPAAAAGLACLVELEIYPRLWFGPLADRDQGRISAQRLRRLDALAAGVAHLAIDRAAVRWALSWSSGDGAGNSLPALDRFVENGLMSRRRAAAVRLLLTADKQPANERSRRRFLHRFADLWPSAMLQIAVLQADLAGRPKVSWREAFEALETLEAEHGDEIKRPSPLLSGRDLQKLLGATPGPRIGRAQQALRVAQVDGDLTNREQAIRWLEGWRKEEEDP
ncbi:MAG: hypothetical protein AAF604_13795 [Acidobacteriota bacterium]